MLDTPWPPQVRETQNDRWQDVGEGGDVDKVFDGGALVDGSGQVVVANHCCCLMRLQAWEDLSKSKYKIVDFRVNLFIILDIFYLVKFLYLVV